MPNDTALDAIYSALRGLALRQRTVADNIANVNTPGYTAQRVSFEGSLRGALAIGNPSLATPDVVASTDPAGVDGNNVNLDDETVSLVQTGLQYQTMLEAMNAKFRLLRDSMKES